MWGHDCAMIESQYTREPAFGDGGGGGAVEDNVCEAGINLKV